MEKLPQKNEQHSTSTLILQQSDTQALCERQICYYPLTYKLPYLCVFMNMFTEFTVQNPLIFAGNSLCVASERLVQATALMKLNQATMLKATTESLEMLEYPFLTMCKFPQGFVLHMGSTVAARSVKLLERVPNPDEPEVRDSWWTELRMEIRSHARALGCNVVLGYSEETTISDDVCVLSATGTAAVINMSYNMESSQTDLSSAKMVFSLDEKDMFKDKNVEVCFTQFLKDCSLL